MDTTMVPVIGAEAVQAWIALHLAPACPAGASISAIPRPWHCKGESAFFAAIDIDDALTVPQLRALEVRGHTRDQHLHFYIDDVIAAAVGTGDLDGKHYHVHYRW